MPLLILFPLHCPHTAGIRALYAAREAEIMAIEGSDERWENWLQFTQSRLVPKFTEVHQFLMINFCATPLAGSEIKFLSKEEPHTVLSVSSPSDTHYFPSLYYITCCAALIAELLPPLISFRSDWCPSNPFISGRIRSYCDARFSAQPTSRSSRQGLGGLGGREIRRYLKS